MHLCLLILLILFQIACVKEDAKVSIAGNAGTETGTTDGGVVRSEDPLASHAWHLENTGQKSFSTNSGISGNDVSIKEVHAMDILGRNIKIAVSDTGADLDHADLAGNALPLSEQRNYVFANSTLWRGSLPSHQGEYHGTGVAGVIAALGWNGIGSRGVAPEAKFSAFRYIIGSVVTDTEDSILAKEIDQMTGDFDIFNYSYGYSGAYFVADDPTIEEALFLGVTELRDGKGALYVQSAGNSFEEGYYVGNDYFARAGNTNAHETLATPFKIVVGASNAIGVRSSYSSPGSSLWISAPGGEYGVTNPAIVTTDISGCRSGNSIRNSFYQTLFDFGFHSLNLSCDYTNRFNGTSAAAPVASGVIALMLEANQNLTWRDVKHILATTADVIDYDEDDNILTHPFENDLSGYVYDYKWVKNESTIYDKDIYFSNWYGFGRINAKAAVDAAIDYDLSTLGDFEQTKDSNDNWYYDSGVLSGKTIANASSTPATSSIWVGHNYIIENIQIKLTVNHPAPGELGIILVSPSGTESRLLNVNSKIIGTSLGVDFQMASNAFYGEESLGHWTIKIVDGSNENGTTGSLTRWKIMVNGHRKSTELDLPYPPTNIGLGTIPSNLTTTPVFTFTDSISPDVIRYEAAVGTSATNESMKSWTALNSNDSHTLTGMSLTSGQTYYLKIRAVNNVGTSHAQIMSWQAN